jgi:uncharacterized membrane protein YgcG
MPSSLLLVVGLFLAPTGEPAPFVPPSAVVRIDPVEVLGKWLALYLKGELDLTGSKLRLRGRNATMSAKDFVSITSGLLPDQDPTRWSHEQELEKLCELVAATQGPHAVRALLDVAAVGLDQRAYEPTMNPVLVRRIAEKHLAKMPAGAERQVVSDLAAATTTPPPLRAAALRALGNFQDELYRPVLETALADHALMLRVAAAEAMSRSQLATVVLPLADRLAAETEVAGRIAMIDALNAIAKRGADIAEAHRRRAVSAVLDNLGQFGWQIDLAALDYLGKVRSVDTVPRLIRVLAVYAEDPHLRKEAEKSALVPYRAHELLVSLTGAVYPANAPAQWQEWWDKVRDEFTLAAVKPAAKEAGEKHTVASSFFGVPVRGTRVLFIVDVSGSMDKEWSGGETKLQVAKRELRSAVEQLAPDAAFNIVTFGDRADAWRDSLAPATKANKEAFFKHVDKIIIAGSTNVWAGLELALRIKTIEQNARYATPADEIFVLSDGAPTTGEIVKPEQILETVSETNRTSRIRINTIYIETERKGGPGGRGGPGGGGCPGGGGGGGRGGWGRGMSGAELMKQLAERNGGSFLRPQPTK